MPQGIRFCAAVVCCVLLCSAVLANNIVFVTSTLSTPVFGNAVAGDSVCQTRANAVGLSGTYKAWLSDSTSSASARFIHSTSPYQLLDGTIIATGWTDLTDGTLAAPISKDESNVAVGASIVWTGTTVSGTFSGVGGDCNGWTTNSLGVVGVRGSPTVSDAGWTNGGTSNCNTAGRLYCFQQIPNPTAADVTVSGRVTNSSGEGFRGAVVTFTDSRRNTFRAVTNAFGYFRIDHVPSGQTYIATVAARRMTFTPRAVTVNDELDNVDFTAL